MKVVICGLTITSSWGNGHATTFRALTRALHARGHEVIFFERDQEWYGSNRDLPGPPFCRAIVYQNWHDIATQVRREFNDCDVAIVGSYCPDGLKAIEEMFDSRAAVKTFYDIDTPITLAKLQAGNADYLKREQVPGFDIYFSFTGGPLLRNLEHKFHARRAVPLYCSFDPQNSLAQRKSNFVCDLSYMGTYAPDRQQMLNELLCLPARELPEKRFCIAGPQYPTDLSWPPNVERIIHLEPKLHAGFYTSSKFTLNVTRRLMVEAGYSPSVRLFEAAGYGTAIISDYWPGLETFLEPGCEILLAGKATDVIGYVKGMNDEELMRIRRDARDRVLSQHSSQVRALEFEGLIAESKAGNPEAARF